jgi:hypothetical protein
MTKRKRLPAHKRSKDEIVAEIMKILEAPRAGKIETRVRQLIDWLCAGCQPFIGNKTANDHHLKGLSEQITRLKKRIARLPPHLTTALFTPELFWQLYDMQGSAFEINPNAREWLAGRNPKRRADLIDTLDRLQAQADQIRRGGLGVHGGIDHRKMAAAKAGRAVIENAADIHPERKLPLSRRSETGAYCRIASLFFEAMTGKQGSDLRRACVRVAPAPSP